MKFINFIFTDQYTMEVPLVIYGGIFPSFHCQFIMIPMKQTCFTGTITVNSWQNKLPVVYRPYTITATTCSDKVCMQKVYSD